MPRELARRPVLAIAGALGLLLLIVSGRYGYHRDELYFLEAGRHHLAWGYPDQPTLTPLLAKVMGWIAPGSLVVLRLPSTLSAAADVVVTALLARDLGAQRGGQVVAAVAGALDGVVLATGHLLSTSTTDLLGWTVLTWLFVRLVQGPTPRLWVSFGLVAGLTLFDNPLVVFLLAGLLVSVLLVGPRDLLRSRWLLVAAVIVAVFGTPYLIWQARHGFPQLDVANGIAHGQSGSSQPRSLFVPLQLLQIGPWLTPLWITGLVVLWRRLRCLSLTYLLLAVVFIVAGGKPYYLGGMYPVLFAAGAQPLLDTRPRLTRALLVLSTPVLVLVLPVVPVRAAGFQVAVNSDTGETVGWPRFVDQISTVVAQQPAGTVVLAENYGEAGAVNRYSSLKVYSGQNAYWYWGRPADGTTHVVAVGFDRSDLTKAFTSVTQAGVLDNGVGIDDDEQDGPIYVCVGPREPWATLWPTFKRTG